MSEKQKGMLLVALTGLLWGSFGVFVRLLIAEGIPLLTIVTGRILIAFIGLLIINSVAKRTFPKIQKKDLVLLITYSIVNIVGDNIFYALSASYIPIAITTILIYLSPIFSLIICYIFLKEKISKIKLISTSIILTGIIMVVNPLNSSNLNIKGILFGILSGLSVAIYNLLGKKLLKHNDPITLAIYSFGIGGFILFIFSLINGQIFITYSIKSIIYLLGFGLVPTLLGIIFYNYGLKKIEAGITSIILTLEPISAALFGLLFLSERIVIIQLFGIILVILGVIFLSKYS